MSKIYISTFIRSFYHTFLADQSILKNFNLLNNLALRQNILSFMKYKDKKNDQQEFQITKRLCIDFNQKYIILTCSEEILKKIGISPILNRDLLLFYIEKKESGMNEKSLNKQLLFQIYELNKNQFEGSSQWTQEECLLFLQNFMKTIEIYSNFLKENNIELK